MTYAFTRTGPEIEAIHNTVTDPSTSQAFTDSIGEQVIPKYTDIVYKASGGNSAVDNMIAGFGIISNIGDICSTGGSKWERISNLNSNIDDFKLLNKLYIEDFGASDGQDSSQSIKDAFLALKDGQTITSSSSGEYLYNALSSENFVDITQNDCVIDMPCMFKVQAGGDGYVPMTSFLVTGSGNEIRTLNVNNDDDIQKLPATASVENRGYAVFLRGKNNTIKSGCKIWNFSVPYRVAGSSNVIEGSTGTVQEIDNIAWPNDIVTINFSDDCHAIGVIGGIHDLSSPRTVVLSNNPKRLTSRARTGIALDAESTRCSVTKCRVGEGFVDGIHSEGSGIRDNDINSNYVYSQLRNALNVARGPMRVYNNTCLPVLNINASGNPNLVGTIGSITDGVNVYGNHIFSDDDTTIGIKALSLQNPIEVESNKFYGDFDTLINALAATYVNADNTEHVSGSCKWALEVSKTSVSSGARAKLDSSTLRVKEGVIQTTSLPVSFRDSTVYMVEGWQPSSDGIIKISGNPDDGGLDSTIEGHFITNSGFFYTGTTTLSGTTSIVKSFTSGDGPKGLLSGNSFDNSVFTTIVSGNFVDPNDWRVSLNSTDSI